MVAKLTRALFRRSSSRLPFVFLAGMCLILVLYLHQPAAIAQTPAIKQAKVTQVLDTNQVYIQNKQAKVNDRAKKGERVRTGKARAQLRFNTGAVARLAYNSVLTVGQCAELQRGTLLVSGAINGCTPSVVAGVRGTTYVLDVDETGQTQVKVLEGVVAVSGVKNSASPVVLRGGEKVAVDEIGSFSDIQRLTELDFVNLLSGSLFKDFNTQIPGLDKVRQSFETLFPGVPFPNLPDIPTISIPQLPRLPF